jgi:predicted lipoprotein with Yx(FWY)xxD motif
MKTPLIFATALALIVSGNALAAESAAKPCEELKSEIAAKLDAKGVTNYTLEIVDKDQEHEGKVVGTCGGGTKKIVYTRK